METLLSWAGASLKKQMSAKTDNKASEKTSAFEDVGAIDWDTHDLGDFLGLDSSGISASDLDSIFSLGDSSEWDILPSLEVSPKQPYLQKPSPKPSIPSDERRFEIGTQTMMYAFNYSPLAVLVDPLRLEQFIKEKLPPSLDKEKGVLNLFPLWEYLKDTPGVDEGTVAVFFEELGRQQLPWKLDYPKLKISELKNTLTFSLNGDIGTPSKSDSSDTSWSKSGAGLGEFIPEPLHNSSKNPDTLEHFVFQEGFSEDEEFGVIPSKRAHLIDFAEGLPSKKTEKGTRERQPSRVITRTLNAVGAVSVDELIQSKPERPNATTIPMNVADIASADSLSPSRSQRSVGTSSEFSPSKLQHASGQDFGRDTEDFTKEGTGSGALQALLNDELDLEDFLEEDFGPIQSILSPAKISQKTSDLDDHWATFSIEGAQKEEDLRSLHPSLRQTIQESGTFGHVEATKEFYQSLKDAQELLINLFTSSPLVLWLDPDAFQIYLGNYIVENVVDDTLQLAPLWTKLRSTPGVHVDFVREFFEEIAKKNLPWKVELPEFPKKTEAFEDELLRERLIFDPVQGQTDVAKMTYSEIFPVGSLVLPQAQAQAEPHKKQQEKGKYAIAPNFFSDDLAQELSSEVMFELEDILKSTLESASGQHTSAGADSLWPDSVPSSIYDLESEPEPEFKPESKSTLEPAIFPDAEEGPLSKEFSRPGLAQTSITTEKSTEALVEEGEELEELPWKNSKPWGLVAVFVFAIVVACYFLFFR